MKTSAVVWFLVLTVICLAREAQGLLGWRTRHRSSPIAATTTCFSSVSNEGNKHSRQDDDLNNSKNNNNNQRPYIARLGVRKYAGKDSKPSGRQYTTRKDKVEVCHVTTQGLEDDYNHYRTVALQGTPDRAVSLWTSDCAAWLQQEHQLPVQPGDLGENMYVEHLAFDDLAVGQRLHVGNTVVLEITEPVIPCANLCKLPYVNHPDKSTPERIQACQDFLQVLDQAPGLRGWYAKVIEPGKVKEHDAVELITDHEDNGK